MSVTRLPRIVLIVGPLFLGACAADGGPGFVGRLNARITGVGGESTVAGCVAFVNVESFRVNGVRTVAKEIVLDDAIESTSMVRVEIDQVVEGRSYNFDVIMAPPAGSEAVGWIAEMDSPYIVGTDVVAAPSYHLDTSGGLIAWGYWPYFGNRWVSAAAKGSTIAIETIETSTGSETTYVYFLAGSEMTITCLADTDRTVTITGTNQYVEIPADCNTMTWPPTPAVVPPTGDRRDFVERMKSAKSAAITAPL